MSPLDFPLVADENIHPDVILFLRQEGRNVRSISEEGLFGQSDLMILRQAHQEGRVVLTHDSDFGTLAVLQGERFTGIIYLRPRHIQAEFTIQSLKTIASQELDVQPSFIVVARRQGQAVQIRVRRL